MTSSLIKSLASTLATMTPQQKILNIKFTGSQIQLLPGNTEISALKEESLSSTDYLPLHCGITQRTSHCQTGPSTTSRPKFVTFSGTIKDLCWQEPSFRYLCRRGASIFPALLLKYKLYESTPSVAFLTQNRPIGNILLHISSASQIWIPANTPSAYHTPSNK